jgi:Spy/CpxP family protein refolding chaperone
MRERKPALKAEQDGKMAAMLTPEQKVKMDEMKKQKKAEKKSRSPKMEARENQPTAE